MGDTTILLQLKRKSVIQYIALTTTEDKEAGYSSKERKFRSSIYGARNQDTWPKIFKIRKAVNPKVVINQVANLVQ